MLRGCSAGRSPVPKRIQMSRQHAWQTDPPAIVVTRSTNLGNPWKVVKVTGSRGRAWDLWVDHTFIAQSTSKEDLLARAVQEFRTGLAVRRMVLDVATDPADALSKLRLGSYPSDEEIIARLRGRDVACTCGLDRPCHGDVLMELPATGTSAIKPEYVDPIFRETVETLNTGGTP